MQCTKFLNDFFSYKQCSAINLQGTWRAYKQGTAQHHWLILDVTIRKLRYFWVTAFIWKSGDGILGSISGAALTDFLALKKI